MYFEMIVRSDWEGLRRGRKSVPPRVKSLFHVMPQCFSAKEYVCPLRARPLNTYLIVFDVALQNPFRVRVCGPCESLLNWDITNSYSLIFVALRTSLHYHLPL